MPGVHEHDSPASLHVLDEVVHHGAEVGLLRDLYSRRGSLGGG